jgi:UDP-N-acetylmuramoylalanine--D-glutamate ligase
MKYSLFGYGISNRSLAKYLVKNGDKVFVSDKRQIPDREKIDGVEYEVGNTKKILDSDVIIISPGIPPTNYIVTEAIKNNIPVLSDIELFYKIFKPKIIAVTGTNGKSTTVSLINKILNKKYVSYIGGNFGVPIFDYADKSYDYLVVEVSSFQLHYTSTFKPYISVILNITPDHIDWHGSFEAYKKAKYNIFKNQDKNDVSILNYQLPYPNTCAKKLTFSTVKRKANYYSKGNVIFENFQEIMSIESKLKGQHNMENILASVAVGRVCDIDKENIAEAVFDFKPLEHRLEIAGVVDNTLFINDSKSTTTDSTLKALDAYRKSVLIVGGRRKGEDYKKFFRTIKDMVSAVVLLGESSDEFEKYCGEFGIKYVFAANMCDAVSKAFEIANSAKNTVLLSPATASYDMFENYKERGKVFKDCVKKLKNSKDF